MRVPRALVRGGRADRPRQGVRDRRKPAPVAGFSFQEFTRDLHGDDQQAAKQRAKQRREILAALDEVHANKGHAVVISDQPDELVSHTRDYGGGARPEDYLEAFSDYITTHVNEVAALNLCVTKPADLTRETLRELELTLDRVGFNATRLNRAISEMTNAEMAADIISLVRCYAIGSVLLGRDRAEYGKKVIDALSSYLTQEYGRGFSRTNLFNMRKFYLAYRDRQDEIVQSQTGQLGETDAAGIAQSRTGQFNMLPELSPFKLSWTHYVLLSSIEDEAERSFYELEAIRNAWDVKTLALPRSRTGSSTSRRC